MFLEPPAKRLRLMGSTSMAQKGSAAAAADNDDIDDEFDELLYEPHEVTERRDPDYKLTVKRIAANNRFQSAMAGIIERFDHDFGETGDEISFATGEVVVDRGHLSSLQVWDRSDEEEEVEGEDEDEGIRLEDLPDDWGEEDAIVGLPGSAPAFVAHEGPETAAQVDVTQPPATSAPRDSMTGQVGSVTRRFEVVIPCRPSPSRLGWSDTEEEIDRHLSINPEEYEGYDSGFGSSSSERRRSGRLRKQVDFLGKITWAEALRLESASELSTAELHPASSHRYASPLTDGDDVSQGLGGDGSKDSGVGNPSPSPPSPSPAAVIPDSQETTVPESLSPIQHSSPPEKPDNFEVEDSDAESDTCLDLSQDSTPAELPGLQFEISAQVRHLESVIAGGLVVPSISTMVEPEDDPFQNNAEEDALTTRDFYRSTETAISALPQPYLTEIPDSQEPSSSAIQDLIGTRTETYADETHEPETLTAHNEEEDELQSLSGVEVLGSPGERAAASSALTSDTPTRPKKHPLLQQITPQPSPNIKHSTPTKRRSSPPHPCTPKHTAMNLSKPPSPRRSILSLVSDDQHDAERKSDSEDDLAVTIPQLFASSCSEKRRRRTRLDAFRTPSKQRASRPMTPLSSGKTCGQGNVKCGSNFCFTCT